MFSSFPFCSRQDCRRELIAGYPVWTAPIVRCFLLNPLLPESRGTSNKGSLVSLERSWHDSRASNVRLGEVIDSPVSYVIALSQGDVMTAGSEGRCAARGDWLPSMRMKVLDDVLLEVTVPRMITAPTRIVTKPGDYKGRTSSPNCYSRRHSAPLAPPLPGRVYALSMYA